MMAAGDKHAGNQGNGRSCLQVFLGSNLQKEDNFKMRDSVTLTSMLFLTSNYFYESFSIEKAYLQKILSYS